MKHLLSKAAIAVMAAASMVGCSNESELAMPEDASNAMRFSLTQRNSSRGTATTSTNYLDQIQGFQVWGHYTAGATGEGVNPGELYVGESATVGTFIKGDGAGAWNYEDILDQQYWPATTAPLNFQAITPESDASFTAKISEGGSGARLCAEVTVPTATADQKDIMLAASLDQTRETNAQCVALTFKHAMSQVVFGARMASEKITAEIASIEIANVHAQGTVGFADDYSLTSQVTDNAETTYSVGLDGSKTTLTTAATVNVTAQDGALFMLPQTVEPWQTAVGSPKALSDADVSHNSYLKVRCTVTDNTSQTVLINDGYVYIPFEIAWEQGKKYAYTLVFGDLAGGFDESGAPLENLLPVSYTVQEVEEWNAVDGGEFGIGGEIPAPAGPDMSGYIKATYNVDDNSQPVKILNNTGYPQGAYLSDIAEMWIEKKGKLPIQIDPVFSINFPEKGVYNVYIMFNNKDVIPEYTFFNVADLTSVVIPEGVTTIGGGAFSNCTSLSSVTLAEGMESIGGYAFQFCASLSSVTLPSTLTEIGNYAFDGCKSLTSIDIPEGVESIGRYAFGACTSLTSVTIPSTVTHIGENIFCTAGSLRKIYVDVNNEKYHSDENNISIIETETRTLIAMCNYAEIPEEVTAIGESVFSGWYNVTKIVIPEGVTKIGKLAFYQCFDLASIVCKAMTAPSLDNSVFGNVGKDGVLTVPTGATGYDGWIEEFSGNWTIQYSDEL